MKVVGISGCVPKSIAETRVAYENFPQHDVDRIIDNTGVDRKREAAPGQMVSDFVIAASRDLLDAVDWDPSTVDAVVLGKTTCGSP